MPKKNIAVAFSTLVLMLIVAWAGFRFLTPSPTPAAEEPVPAGAGTPQRYIPSEFKRQATSSKASTHTLLVKGEGGQTIAVKDFTKTAAQDKNNVDVKYLAGKDENGYIENVPYVILYSGDDESFTVSLRSQPLGVTRARGEDDLLAQLGITEGEACSLRYVVLVPFEIDKNYAGRNLGFSFCEGAVSLP